MNNPFSLQNKTIVITGASSGIGRQCAISCSAMGAKVVLLARDQERLQKVLSELSGFGHAYYSLDLQDFNSYANIINDIVIKNGKVSGFIHSAGIEATIPLNALKKDTFSRVFEINTISFFELVRYLSKNKYVEKNASFIAITSIMGVLGEKGKLAYCASKSALISGTKALALELASKNIRVNCISPAVINTPMVEDLFSTLSGINKQEIVKAHPLGLGTTEDVANACIFLLSDASKWITGTNLIVDGGYSAK